MNKPVFRDTSHLTERRKCALALAQALENKHSDYRIRELTKRLMRFGSEAV
jgi:predicted site-specific integrase-resolvase